MTTPVTSFDHQEVVARLGGDVERVGVDRRGAGSDGQRSAGAALQRSLDALETGLVGDVVLVVRVVGLHGGLSLTHRGLGLGVLRTLALAEEGGQSDRGEDADDQDHDQELDEREALLVLSAVRSLSSILSEHSRKGSWGLMIGGSRCIGIGNGRGALEP